MSVVAYQAISTYLQAQWTLIAPAKTDIDWLTTRYDVKNWLGNPKSNNVAVACLSGRSDTHRISNTAYKTNEGVDIQIYIKGNLQNYATSQTLRDTVYNAIETLIATNPGAIPNINITDLANKNSVETPQLLLKHLNIICRYLTGT